ncbi:MAG: GntR family transcriptional regulator [Albidovulum sp.]|nr:GntR family transcriptional regulator [Albidovulum sp.]MDE0532486.1 GntR family transcriptional regulator [Albidovulum sp.]
MTDSLIRHQIYEQLRSDIMSCALSPGIEFREGELAGRFGVSKSPIRDALQRLEIEGLVEIQPRRGYKVAPISIADAEDILELRGILEAGAIRVIVARASDADLNALERLKVASTSDTKAFADYNREFHCAICRASGNARLAGSMGLLMDNYDRLCVVSLSANQDNSSTISDALEDHNTIVDAIRSRNAGAAIRASARHLKQSHDKIMRGLQNMPVVL